MNQIAAGSLSELTGHLKAVGTLVPRRSKGRTHHQVETRVVCRFLSTLGYNDCLSFLLTIRHRDKPDFEIQFSHTSIGIEVTEATSEQLAWASFLRDKYRPNAFLFAWRVANFG